MQLFSFAQHVVEHFLVLGMFGRSGFVDGA